MITLIMVGCGFLYSNEIKNSWTSWLCFMECNLSSDAPSAHKRWSEIVPVLHFGPVSIASALLVLEVELGLWVLIISRPVLVAVRAPGEALLGSISSTWGEAWLMGSSLQSSLWPPLHGRCRASHHNHSLLLALWEGLSVQPRKWGLCAEPDPTSTL